MHTHTHSLHMDKQRDSWVIDTLNITLQLCSIASNATGHSKLQLCGVHWIDKIEIKWNELKSTFEIHNVTVLCTLKIKHINYIALDKSKRACEAERQQQTLEAHIKVNKKKMMKKKSFETTSSRAPYGERERKRTENASGWNNICSWLRQLSSFAFYLNTGNIESGGPW